MILGTEIITLSEGIRIIDKISQQPGIDTLEGRVGPLLQGVNSQAHYIEMPPDLYVEEHPHSSESIIYTVQGRWVLCSRGQRHVMEAGSLFWFGPNIPTGYEMPFVDPAYILIFKGTRLGTTEEFVDYLYNTLRPKFIKQQADGEACFRLTQLPADHPARLFARSLQEIAHD